MNTLKFLAPKTILVTVIILASLALITHDIIRHLNQAPTNPTNPKNNTTTKDTHPDEQLDQNTNNTNKDPHPTKPQPKTRTHDPDTPSTAQNNASNTKYIDLDKNLEAKKTLRRTHHRAGYAGGVSLEWIEDVLCSSRFVRSGASAFFEALREGEI